MTTAKTAAELEAMIMEVLGEKPECKDLIGVVVAPADGEDGNWRVAATCRNGIEVPRECNRELIHVAIRLKRDYHLLTDA